MFWFTIVSLSYSVILCDSRILLYNTENVTSSSEKFDCIYVLDLVGSEYGGSSAGKVPYCRRPDITEDRLQDINQCKHGAETKYFVDLVTENIRPFEVLGWSSSVDVADEYAAFYYKNDSMINSDEKQTLLCHCARAGTFGKYCEYELTHEADSFESSQNSQAMNRTYDQAEHQRYGDIACYKTLSCNSGLLCLDWRDICNGKQQCESGWDEENCDKLEFNECEDDEYRCTNGMCIPEEYWLDGTDMSLRRTKTEKNICCILGNKDCMDWSDEIFIDKIGVSCFQRATTIDCDEHICPYFLWSCGDGQCIYWRYAVLFEDVLFIGIGCNNLRHINYMCELSLASRGWTLPNGLCWIFSDRYDDPQLSMNNMSLTNGEKCVYLIRCVLSDGGELDCSCNRSNCSSIMANVCDTNTDLSVSASSIIWTIHSHIL